MTGLAAPLVVERRQTHAGGVLAVWVMLLVLVPSVLVVGPLGAAGSPAQMLGLLAGSWWLAAQLDRSRATLTPGEPAREAMAVFALAMIVSYIAATTRPIEAVELSAADRGLLVVLSWWGVTLLTTDGLISRQSIDALLRLLTAVTAVAATIGLLQFVTGSSIIDQISIPGLTANKDLAGIIGRNGLARVFGTSSHPIEFGVLLTMVLPLAIHYATYDTHRARWRRYLPVVLICAALPVTMSRSALIGVAVVLVVLFPLWPGRRRAVALVAVAVGLVVVYLAVPGLLGTMLRLFTNISSDSSAQSRTDSYGLAFTFIGRAPIFGRGLSTFLPSYRILDNQYLGTLIEAGIVGLLALLGLFIAVIVEAHRMSVRLPREEDRDLARSLMASVASAALACATFDAFGFPQVAGALFFAIGCIGALNRHTHGLGGRRRQPGDAPGGRRATVAAGRTRALT